MQLGFIGLGLMGRGMAANLRKAGFDLAVHDIRRESAEPLLAAGATWAETPKVLAKTADVIFTSLPRPSDVEMVLDRENGLAGGLRPGTAWFDLSTNSVDLVRTLHARLLKKDVHFMDAPVSGGPAGAASGKLAIWVGGNAAVFERCRPALEAMGDQARYIGETGAGSIAKLVHNLISTVLMQAVAEGMTIGVKAGLEPLQLFEAIRAGATGRARTFDIVHRRWLPENLDPPTFQLQLLHKDVRLAVELARQVGVPSKLSQIAFEEMTEALNRGWGARDAQSVLMLQQERAGLESFGLSTDDVAEIMNRS